VRGLVTNSSPFGVALKVLFVCCSGLAAEVIDSVQRTKHHWSFLSKMGDEEQHKLDMLRNSVVATTNTSAKRDEKRSTIPALTPEPAVSSHDRTWPFHVQRQQRGFNLVVHEVLSRCIMLAFLFLPRFAAEEERERRAKERDAARKAERRRVSEYLDDVAPKAAPGSREAQIEKRMEVASKLHGGARDREAAMDGLDVGESVLMGSSGRDDFASAVAAQKAREARRQQQRAERGSALQVLAVRTPLDCHCAGVWIE
jgi:hypothetical protein